MTEATRTENESLIQEMIRDAEKVNLKDEFSSNPVVHKGDADLDAPMVAKEVSTAGYVWVWETRTYEKLPVLYYMLPAKLRQRRPDGSFRFTTVDPKKDPRRGTLKCFLHKDDPNRKHYDEMGFRLCSKANLTNEYERRRHMNLKHPKEWDSLESERKDRERLEDRELQKMMIASITKTPLSEPVVEATNPIDEVYKCDICGKEVSSPLALAGHKRTHK